MKRTTSLIAAVALAISSAVPQFAVTAADDSYDMNISIDLSGEKKAISPYIYGVNEYGNGTQLKNVTVNAVRQGGNRYTGYNWENNYSNAGEDWHNSSDTNIGDITDGPGAAALNLSKQCTKHNVPYKITTLQMAGYASADKDGTVKPEEAAPSKRWVEVKASKGAAFAETPDLDDGVVYMDEYVNYIVNKLGDSSTETGINGYSLDNEPVLWNDTHPLLHPEEVSNKELISKSIELAKAVKAVDPKAEIYGPAFWGMLPCMFCGDSDDGFQDEEWRAVKNNYRWYMEFYLDQMKKAEEECGTRLLDVFDVHYYAQDCATDEAILQGARSLYDPSYVENSWLQPWAGQYFPFLPNIKKSIDTYYPGTKIAISEYNIANIANEKNTGKSVVSALAEAEALGAFAMNEVYFATYWGTLPDCPYAASAINLYTNYDGKGGCFGDTLVSTKSEDLSKAAAFASINGTDDSKVTLVLSNKNMTKAENAVIDLTGTDTKYKSAVVYSITQEHSDIRVTEVQNNVSENKVTIELPPLSVAQIVISDKESDEKLYEAPQISEKTETFRFDELEDSKNGYKMIPLGDVSHLKKAVIDLDCSCSSGASWYCGGGALTFNKLKGSGDEFWGFKSFGYASGATTAEIVFDGTFSDGDNDDLEAVINDTYSEFQDWWKSSANDESGDDVSVTYKSITLYYEYDSSEKPSEPATEPATKEPSSTPATEPATTPATTPNNGDILYGDANCDGVVTIADCTLILQTLGNPDLYKLSEQGKKNADCCDNGDGISGLDALAIQKLDAKIIKSLPIKSEKE